MARNFNGGTDRIQFGNGVSGFSKGAMCLRIKTTQTTASVVPASCWESAGSANGFGFLLNNVANKISAYGKSGGSQSFLLASTTTINDGNWHSVALTWVYNTSAALFVDGTTENSTAAVSGPNGSTSAQIVVGDNNDSFWPTPVADIADFAIWLDGAPSNDDLIAFTKGFSPALIGAKGAAKFLYAPLVRDARDLFAGDSATVTGTTVSDHPRVIGGMI